MSSGAPHPPRDDADAMRWVANVLLGELADDPEIVVGRKAPSGHRVLWTFSMLPGGDDPYVLIPPMRPAPRRQPSTDSGTPCGPAIGPWRRRQDWRCVPGSAPGSRRRWS